MTQQALNVGLVGYGLAGRVFHAPLIASTPGLHLHTVVERHSEHARARYPWVQIARSLDDLLAQPAIDLVVVATPNTLHHAQAQAALAAGKHVVVDKPFTVDSAESAALIDQARAAGRVLSVFHNRRWDGDFRTVSRLVHSGRLGDIVEFEAAYDRYRPALKDNAWREKGLPGSGILFDLGSHLIDQALTLFGLPGAVSADVRRQRPGAQADDAFTVTLHTAPTRITLQAGMLVRPPRPRFRVIGTLGSYVKHGLDPQEDALKRGLLPGDGWGMEAPDQWGTLDVVLDGLPVRGTVETLPGTYQAYYADVRDAVISGRDPAVTALDGHRVMQVLEWARQSSAERRTVVCDWS